NIHGNTQLCFCTKAIHQVSKETSVTIRRLEKNLCLFLCPRFPFKFAYDLLNLLRATRKVTVKCKLLAIETRCHQRKQYRGRADQRHDSDAVPVSKPHGKRSGIGDTRAPGFRQNTHVTALKKGIEKFPELTFLRILVQY